MANHIHCRRVVGSHRGHSSSTTPRPRVCGWGSACSTARRSPRGRPPGPGGRSGTAPSRPRRTVSVSPFPALSHFARVDHSPRRRRLLPPCSVAHFSPVLLSLPTPTAARLLSNTPASAAAAAVRTFPRTSRRRVRSGVKNRPCSRSTPDVACFPRGEWLWIPSLRDFTLVEWDEVIHDVSTIPTKQRRPESAPRVNVTQPEFRAGLLRLPTTANDVRVRRALALSLVIGVICNLFRLFSVIAVLLQLLPPLEGSKSAFLLKSFCGLSSASST